MSPDESQLRAALRTGEGDTVSADDVMFHAQVARRTRRTTLAAMGGAVAAVLVIGGVVTAVQLNSGQGTHGSGPSAGGTGPGGVAVLPVDCPARPPTVDEPRDSAPGDLFPANVTAMRICLYKADKLAGRTLLDERQTASYVLRFNALTPVNGFAPCPQFLTQLTIVMLPSTPDGPAAAVVGRLGGCMIVTNGTTKRRASDLLGELAGLPAAVPDVPGASGKKSPGPGPS